MERLSDRYARLSDDLSVFEKLMDTFRLSQTDLGKGLGMSRSRLNSYIKGRFPITLKVARMLQGYARSFRVEISLDEIYRNSQNDTKIIRFAKRCIELAKAKGIDLTLEEIFENDSGEEENE